MLNREYSPGDEFQGWAAAQLALLGNGEPVNYSEVGYMELTFADTSTAKGILHASSTPASGQYETGVQYDPSAISGPIYLTTKDGIREITQNFTIQNVTTQDGENLENFTITNRTYETTNTTDLKKLYDELAKLKAEIEARNSTIGGSGGAVFGVRIDRSPVVVSRAVFSVGVFTGSTP